MKTNIILDAGHGGLDENKNYTTAPNKMFTFPDGDVIYEGVINRIIAQKIYDCFLIDVENKHRISFTVSPENAIDLGLRDRVEFANNFNPKNTILVSIHNNAGGGSGFEIYTSKGETESDKIATSIYESVSPTYKKYDLPMRKDITDGDVDKEAQFYVLRKTICPAVLCEYAFFDNKKDANLLRDEEFLNSIAFDTYHGISNYINKRK